MVLVGTTRGLGDGQNSLSQFTGLFGKLQGAFLQRLGIVLGQLENLEHSETFQFSTPAVHRPFETKNPGQAGVLQSIVTHAQVASAAMVSSSTSKFE